MKFNFYTDPGHAWIKVPLKLLEELDIANKITNYSYIRKEYAYLEEDCDLQTFHKAMEKAKKIVILKEFHTNRESKIRNYCSYYYRIQNNK
jgi:hypothetical protein